MKNTTLAMIIIAAGLAVLAIVLAPNGKGDKQTLKIPGYATKAQLAEERNRDFLDSAPPIPHPITGITISRDLGGVTQVISLVRDGDGKDATWALISPVEAPAVRHIAEKIAALFRTETVSTFSTSIEADGLPVYDLEPDARIRLTLVGGIFDGVDLFVGAAVAGDKNRRGETLYDTWVMRANDPTTLYRVVGKDLRAPLEITLETVRDKKVFSIAPDDIDAITVTPPARTLSAWEIKPSVTLTASRSAEASPDDSDKPASAMRTWTITSPTGFVADTTAGSLPRSFANLRALAFVPAAEATTNALEPAPWVLTASTAGGDVTITMADAPPLTGGEDADFVWAQVSGRDEWLKLQTHQAKALKRSVEDLRKKALFDLDPDAITGLTFTSPTGPVWVTRGDTGWTFAQPTTAFPADPTHLLPSITALQRVRYARPAEITEARAALATASASTIDGVVQTASETHAFRFSAKIKGGGDNAGKRWGVVGDPASGEPFLIADFNAKRFESDVDTLRQKKVFPDQTEETLRRMELSRPGATSVTLERADATAPWALTADSTQLPPGQQLDAGVIKTLAATGATLTAKSFATEPQRAAGQASLGVDRATRLTLVFEDGTRGVLSVSPDAVSSKEGHLATVDSGPLKGAVFAINVYQAKNLTKRLEALATPITAP